MFEKKPITIVANDGTEQNTNGFIAGSELVIISDMNVVLEPGYEIRRVLPNGKEEVFNVIDPVYYEKGPGGQHYQVEVKRAGLMDRGTGGNHYHVTGNNARININSTDNSHNAVGDRSVFGDISNAVANSDIPDDHKQIILDHVRDMEASAGKSSAGYLSSFQKFTAASVPWISIVGEYIPALTKWLSSGG